jgi:hypothetical protein
MSLYVPYYRPYNKHNTNIHTPGGIFFFLSGVSPLWSIFVLFKSFRPSCHFTFHITVLTTNTTQTSKPPVGYIYFFLPVRGFSPLDPFLYCLNPFVLHVTLRSILPSLQHNRNIHAPGGIRTHNPSKRAAEDPRLRLRGHWDRRFEPTIPASERPQTQALDRTATEIASKSSIARFI